MCNHYLQLDHRLRAITLVIKSRAVRTVPQVGEKGVHRVEATSTRVSQMPACPANPVVVHSAIAESTMSGLVVFAVSY
jgi:hypothetical protein